MNINKKNIIFDLGNVLIKWDANVVYAKYFANDLKKVTDFYEETAIKKINIELDRGSPCRETLMQLAEQFPHYREPILMWDTKWTDMIGGPIVESVNILESLRQQNYPLYALTNWSHETFFLHIRHNEKYNFLNYFKDIVVSGVEKVVKPDHEIYQILLQRNKLNAEDCIFIDDTVENLIAAQELGMQIIKFVSPQQLERDLDKVV